MLQQAEKQELIPQINNLEITKPKLDDTLEIIKEIVNSRLVRLIFKAEKIKKILSTIAQIEILLAIIGKIGGLESLKKLLKSSIHKGGLEETNKILNVE